MIRHKMRPNVRIRELREELRALERQHYRRSIWLAIASWGAVLGWAWLLLW